MFKKQIHIFSADKKIRQASIFAAVIPFLYGFRFITISVSLERRVATKL